MPADREVIVPQRVLKSQVRRRAVEGQHRRGRDGNPRRRNPRLASEKGGISRVGEHAGNTQAVLDRPAVQTADPHAGGERQGFGLGGVQRAGAGASDFQPPGLVRIGRGRVGELPGLQEGHDLRDGGVVNRPLLPVAPQSTRQRGPGRVEQAGKTRLRAESRGLGISEKLSRRRRIGQRGEQEAGLAFLRRLGARIDPDAQRGAAAQEEGGTGDPHERPNKTPEQSGAEHGGAPQPAGGSETTCTDTTMRSKALAGPSQLPASGQAFSCSRATATDTCSKPASLLFVGSNPRQPVPGM